MVTIRNGSSLRDRMQGNDLAEVFFANEGDDTVFAAGGNDRVFGGDGNDTLNGEGGDDIIHGDAGDDVIDGGIGTNQLFGDIGNDRFKLQSGVNAVDGGEGIDTVDYSLQAQQFHMGQPTGNGVQVDLTTGSGGFGASGDTYVGIENVIGSVFNDIIIENSDANVIDAGAGNDTVMSTGGRSDSFNGGDGIDWIDFSRAIESYRGLGGVIASLEQGRSGSGYGYRTSSLSNFENMRGSDFDDSLEGNSGVNTIEGGAGNDTLRGLGGGDTLDGGEGNDTLDGGEGTDMADYAARSLSSPAGVTVDLGSGKAWLLTAAGSETDTLSNIEGAFGTTGNDLFIGNNGDNVFAGNAGNDTFWGSLGADKMDGGEGVDTLDYSTSLAGVRINLETGLAAGGDAEGDGFANVENVQGSRVAGNELTGSSDDNRLTGGNLSDTIDGGKGDDTIVGGLGADKLAGGLGSDTFIFNLVTGTGTSSTDDVMDFEVGEDHITFGISSAPGKVQMEAVNGGTLVWYETEDGTRTDQAMLWGVDTGELKESFDTTFDFVALRSRVDISTDGQIGYDWDF